MSAPAHPEAKNQRRRAELWKLVARPYRDDEGDRGTRARNLEETGQSARLTRLNEILLDFNLLVLGFLEVEAKMLHIA
jgi:hypothetical protein